MDAGAGTGLVADLRFAGGPLRLHVWPARETDTPAASRPVLLAFHGWTDSGGVVHLDAGHDVRREAPAAFVAALSAVLDTVT